jgi:hypothetical protein
MYRIEGQEWGGTGDFARSIYLSQPNIYRFRSSLTLLAACDPSTR